MKKLILGIALLAGIFSIQSCKEEINLIGEFKETAIVYGLLDQSDSVHMIKITRAFIGPGNSLQIAQIPDSSYFPSVDATITEIGGMNRTWTLQDTLIDNKDPNGVFYAPQQKVYYFATPVGQPLDEDATYKLDINVNNGLFSITAQTQLVKGLGAPSLSGQTGRFKFADDPGQYKQMTVGVSTGNAHQINMQVNVEYNEFISGAVQGQKSFDWVWGETEVEPGTTKGFSANGQTFFELMKESCATSDPLIDRRTLSDITITLTGASEDLVNYILVNQPSSSLAQNKPTFTNLSATNDHPVIGIFSSRQTVKIVKAPFIQSQAIIRSLDKNSTRELCIGPISGPCLFCSQHPGDISNGESFICN